MKNMIHVNHFKKTDFFHNFKLTKVSKFGQA